MILHEQNSIDRWQSLNSWIVKYFFILQGFRKKCF